MKKGRHFERMPNQLCTNKFSCQTRNERTKGPPTCKVTCHGNGLRVLISTKSSALSLQNLIVNLPPLKFIFFLGISICFPLKNYMAATSFMSCFLNESYIFQFLLTFSSLLLFLSFFFNLVHKK